MIKRNYRCLDKLVHRKASARPGTNKLYCPHTKDTIHLPRFVDFSRVSQYARGTSKPDHFSLRASSLLSYSRSSLRRCAKSIVKKNALRDADNFPL